MVAEIRIDDTVDPLELERRIAETELKAVFDGIPLCVFRIDLLVFLEVVLLKVEHN